MHAVEFLRTVICPHRCYQVLWSSYGCFDETFEIERENLKRSYDAFCYTWDWFQCQEYIWPGCAACHWKVDIGNDLSGRKINVYLPHGSVILAALYLAYNVHRIRRALGPASARGRRCLYEQQN